ncbi:hypothetical protein V493_01347 [Pseudogymnoascus sp. VKM F-4281 (FW-2241)]|nr:hypothetical protein V493_01347 [Pseudogymnoascus sp. VKM F-4281 (FW-2241)]
MQRQDYVESAVPNDDRRTNRRSRRARPGSSGRGATTGPTGEGATTGSTDDDATGGTDLTARWAPAARELVRYGQREKVTNLPETSGHQGGHPAQSGTHPEPRRRPPGTHASYAPTPYFSVDKTG